MNETQRRAYLQAMGIDIWVPRMPGFPAPGAVSSAPSQASGSEDLSTLARPVPAATSVPDKAPARGTYLSRTDMPEAGIARISSSADRDVSELDWNALQTCVAGCTQCGLHATRTQTVFGVGSRTADWLFVGEAPGADEDRQGEPFVGRAGQLLNSMLRAIGLSREQVYIANILKCRPPGNRDPGAEEAHACEPYLKRQIALLQPRIIIALGRTAAQHLLNTHAPLGRLRGRPYSYTGAEIPLLVTFHPAYLLRSPGHKRTAWEDLLLAQRLVNAPVG